VADADRYERRPSPRGCNLVADLADPRRWRPQTLGGPLAGPRWRRTRAAIELHAGTRTNPGCGRASVRPATSLWSWPFPIWGGS